MRIVECELTRLRVPFKRVFRHAAASRAFSDAIIVCIITETGKAGFGEIQARPYVTGESNDEIWERSAIHIARTIMGAVLEDHRAVVQALGCAEAYAASPALIGRFDLALLNALELEQGSHWEQFFGPLTTRTPRKCLTIGEDFSGDDLRNQARLARLRGCNVIKLKVNGAQDAGRIKLLRESAGQDTAIRLDANGQLTPEGARELLRACADQQIESLEEPFDQASASLEIDLQDLHQQTGTPLVADESICTVADVHRFASRKAYQCVNIRVGKCGGISGTAAVLRAALDADFDLVAGTMVGESAVLLRTSRKMLQHCERISYVEGIEQARELLESEPIVEVSGQRDRMFDWVPDAEEKYIVGREKVK